jgi:hypothetical protein
MIRKVEDPYSVVEDRVSEKSGIRAEFAGIFDRNGGRNILHPRILYDELNDGFDEFESWQLGNCFSWDVIGKDVIEGEDEDEDEDE